MDPYIGEIKIVPFTKIPNGWAPCNGQKMAIRENEALYSIIGTTYGGDGETYFNLPDMRGRSPIGMGQGTGLSRYALGQKAGAEKPLINDAHDAQNGVGVLQTTGRPEKEQQPVITGNHSIMQPALTLNFIISLGGLYPGRN